MSEWECYEESRPYPVIYGLGLKLAIFRVPGISFCRLFAVFLFVFSIFLAPVLPFRRPQRLRWTECSWGCLIGSLESALFAVELRSTLCLRPSRFSAFPFRTICPIEYSTTSPSLPPKTSWGFKEHNQNKLDWLNCMDCIIRTLESRCASAALLTLKVAS